MVEWKRFPFDKLKSNKRSEHMSHVHSIPWRSTMWWNKYLILFPFFQLLFFYLIQFHYNVIAFHLQFSVEKKTIRNVKKGQRFKPTEIKSIEFDHVKQNEEGNKDKSLELFERENKTMLKVNHLALWHNNAKCTNKRPIETRHFALVSDKMREKSHCHCICYELMVMTFGRPQPKTERNQIETENMRWERKRTQKKNCKQRIKTEKRNTEEKADKHKNGAVIKRARARDRGKKAINALWVIHKN